MYTWSSGRSQLIPACTWSSGRSKLIPACKWSSGRSQLIPACTWSSGRSQLIPACTWTLSNKFGAPVVFRYRKTWPTSCTTLMSSPGMTQQNFMYTWSSDRSQLIPACTWSLSNTIWRANGLQVPVGVSDFSSQLVSRLNSADFSYRYP
jgi:hypothetical protein